MRSLEELQRRLVLLFRRADVHRAVDDEIRFHIDMTARELIDRGWSRDEATAEARRRFGDIDRFRSQSRLIGERTVSRRQRRETLSNRVQDLRYALRVLARSPSFSIVSILTLGLGIGATAAVFSVVHGVLLQPLGYPEPEKLVRIQATYTDDWDDRGNISEMDFLDFRERNTTLESIAAFNWTGGGVTLNTPDSAIRLVAVRTTHDYFEVLRARPFIGRTYTAEEDQPGADPVIVLSHGVWARHFGSDPEIVGREIRLSGFAVTVLGVMPPDFLHPDLALTPPDVWVPLAINRARNNRGAHYLRSIGRLRPDATLAEANAELMAISEALEADYPDSNTSYRATVEGLHDVSVGAAGRSLWLLFGAVGVLLLIAVVNVAALFVARAAARRRELAMRRALGGSGPRLAALLLTESVTLSVAGGLLGIGAAWVMTRLLLGLAAGSVPLADNVGLSPTVLLFTAAVMMASGVLFGLAPVLHVPGSGLVGALMESGRGSSAGPGRSLLRTRLVIAETALAVVLVVAGGLLLKSFVRLQQVDLGIDPEHVIAARVSLAGPAYPDRASNAAFYEELIRRLSAHPGLTAAAAVDYLPLATGHSNDSFQRDDLPPPPPGQGPSAEFRRVSDDYFSALGIGLVRGRLLTSADDAAATRVIVIDTETARQFWPDQDPIGRSITTHDTSWTIVGIVESVRHFGPDVEASPMLYISHQQEPIPWLTVVVRGTLDSARTTAAVRRHVRDLDPSLPVFGVETLSELAARSVARPRFQTLLVALFSLAALLLAATGVYGLTAYTVAQRTQEIGVRVALGARSADIRQMVVGGALRLTVIGVALGLLAYIPLRNLLEGMLYGVSTVDPWILAAVVGVLFAISATASYLPSRRVVGVDPSDSLRVG